MNSSVNHLGLFAKFWEPGRVKTRLAATLGNQLACELYQIFLFHLLNSVAPDTDRATVVFSPTNREADFRTAIPENWMLEPQSNGDLGDRMRTFFDQHLHAQQFPDAPSDMKQATKVVVIGADCPQLTAAEIQTAFDELDKNDVVIGPSTDGGYYLLGMKGGLAEVFDDIDWSTSAVLAQTTQRLDQQNKSYALLPPRTDVDDEAALRTMLAGLSTATAGESISSASQTLFDKLSAALPKNKLP